MASKRWGVALKTNVMIPTNANRKASRYPIKAAKVFRRFDSRNAAREFAASRKNPVVIVDTFMWEAVR